MHVNGDLLSLYLEELAACGAEPGGGCYRGLYTAAWAEACDRVEGWMADAGLSIRRDAVGNRWGLLQGTDHTGSIVTGSHIDTVRRGGRLDGALGIVAGIVALRTLAETHGRPKRSIEILATCEEEGSRFATNFWGARAIVGSITPQEAKDAKDDDGISLATAMVGQGLDPEAVRDVARDDLDVFIELHIEQGGVLETAGRSLGVVASMVGAEYLDVTVRGRADHAGTTPMGMRHDALAGAAEMIQAVERSANEEGPPAVATVGKLDLDPAQTNVVPQSATFVVDLRHDGKGQLQALADRIRRACSRIAARRNLEIEFRTRHGRDPVVLDGTVAALLERAATAEGVEPLRMVSGAGHDAQILATSFRTGMLFVPSIGGRSHSPEEATETADLVLGTRVLTRALYDLAY